MALACSHVIGCPTVRVVEGTCGCGDGPSGASRAATAGGVILLMIEEGPALAASIGEDGGGGCRWYTMS
jgi:hypothetical protein